MTLIDDSIGSGTRVSKFIKLMTTHPTFKSWWSFGFMTLHVLSLARTVQAEELIRNNIPGSDHWKRKHRKRGKVKFESEIVYDANRLDNRWGGQWPSILGLCDKIKAVAEDRRRGYGNVMGNLVFYHSVPNNLPGLLWSSRDEWKALFPGRALPQWCESLLETQTPTDERIPSVPLYQANIPQEVLMVLLNIKRGIRTKAGLARRLDLDIRAVNETIYLCRSAGFVSEGLHLTKAGEDVIYRTRANRRTMHKWNRSLFVPSSWCTG